MVEAGCPWNTGFNLFLSQTFESHSYAVRATLHGWLGQGRTLILRVKSSAITSQGVNQVIPVSPRIGGVRLESAPYFKRELRSLFRVTWFARSSRRNQRQTCVFTLPSPQ